MHRIIKYYFIALDLSFQKKKKLGHLGQTPDAIQSSLHKQSQRPLLFFFAKIIHLGEIYVRISEYFLFISKILL